MIISSISPQPPPRCTAQGVGSRRAQNAYAAADAATAAQPGARRKNTLLTWPAGEDQRTLVLDGL
jgi:hypothetical protein